MIRRWLIRVPCLLALALVVGVWITSHVGWFALYNSAGGKLQGVGAVQGLGFIAQRRDASLPDELLRVQFAYRDTAERWLGFAPRFGFFAGRSPIFFMNMSVIVFPLWLPTLLLAGLLWLVWRKTRPKYNGRGFPVEAAGKEATQP